MNVVLCGMPGSGKTVTAVALEKLTGKKSVDTDALIVETHGNIAEIFAKFGEEYFRTTETETCKNLADSNDLIIATGGGCVLREINVNYLKRNGVIFYLRAQKQTILNRIAGNCDRPLLLGDVESRTEKLIKERSPIYERVADFVIDTDGLSPQQTAEIIVKTLKEKI